jgi:hypothetical protein
MSRSGYDVLFPGRDPAAISDTAFLLAIRRLSVPYYLYKQRYSQFCIETGRPPDWHLFHDTFGPDPADRIVPGSVRPMHPWRPQG